MCPVPHPQLAQNMGHVIFHRTLGDEKLADRRVDVHWNASGPHPELANRNFVLLALKEIAHDTIHPILKETIGDLWLKSKDRSIIRSYVPAE